MKSTLTQILRKWLPIGLSVAMLPAGCKIASTPAQGPLTVSAGPALPDRDIVFLTDINQLGFINADGSGYISYSVNLSQLPNYYSNALPTLYDMITWSSDGRFIVGRYTVSHRGGGFPILLSTTGDLTWCPPESSLYGAGRIWMIDGTTVLTVDTRDKVSRIVAFDVSTCTITNTFYIATPDERIGETALSAQGWLAINRAVRNNNAVIDEILILSPDGKSSVTLPNAIYPTWSKDGEWIAFCLYKDSLYIARKDGSDMRKIVGDLEVCPTFSWSPDGQWIIYDHPVEIGDGSGKRTPAIFKVNVATGTVYELFRGGYSPDWRLDQNNGDAN